MNPLNQTKTLQSHYNKRLRFCYDCTNSSNEWYKLRTYCEKYMQILCHRLLKNGYFEFPKVFQKQYTIAEHFKNKWNFLNCLGFIDGKHIYTQCPANSRSLYFNYKNLHGTVFVAAVGVKYKFIIVEFAAYGGRNSDSMFAISKIGRAINSELLDVPNTRHLDSSDKVYPNVFVGDEVFPSKTIFMKPYSKHSLSTAESRIMESYEWGVLLKMLFGFRFQIPLSFVYFIDIYWQRWRTSLI